MALRSCSSCMDDNENSNDPTSDDHQKTNPDPFTTTEVDDLQPWPPKMLGFVPKWRGAEPLGSVTHLDRVLDNGIWVKDLNLTYPTGLQQHNLLLKIWSASLTHHHGCEFLELPDTAINGHISSWGGFDDSSYPSNLLFVRDSYKLATQRIFEFDALSITKTRDNKRQFTTKPFLVAGSSGIGKTFFANYFIHTLFHCRNQHLPRLPDTIVYKAQPKDPQGYVYHRGSFFSCADILSWINTSEAKCLLDNKDAWVISDGPMAIGRYCRFLIIASPGNFQDPLGSKMEKTTQAQVYLPPWSFDELAIVAKVIFGWGDAEDLDIKKRYQKHGGIARYVLMHKATNHPTDPISKGLSWTEILDALKTRDSNSLDHSKVPGAIMHLFPDPGLKTYQYNWGSTYIMERAFETLFKWEKRQLTCFIKGAVALHFGTFYGILFEQFFHSQILSNGYTGRCKQLEPPTRKRKVFGISDFLLKIPKLVINKFTTIADIVPSCLNVPDVPNHPTLDSIFPDYGLIFRVTSAAEHPIKGNYLGEYEKKFSIVSGSDGAKRQVRFRCASAQIR